MVAPSVSDSSAALSRWLAAAAVEDDAALRRATVALTREYKRAAPADASEIVQAVFPYLDDDRKAVQWAAVCVMTGGSPNRPPRLPGFITAYVADEAGQVLFRRRWTPSPGQEPDMSRPPQLPPSGPSR